MKYGFPNLMHSVIDTPYDNWNDPFDADFMVAIFNILDRLHLAEKGYPDFFRESSNKRLGTNVLAFQSILFNELEFKLL